ncbi:hypothetical protein L3X38_003484 [Prunus dulcis]|uniref:Uncharacterized protein n=1 Tax=Prunus dulcis TaxID=3755 RepID=A0AAD4ZM44_PRUDU|nr:hypothetical protein L3X38_003484 [Prunus dulcis]
MPGVEIDRSTLWKRARQDKHGNIPDPKVAEKAKLIDELQKQVSEGKVSVYGSNDVLTMALGPEHPGRVRGVGAGISPRQYFKLPKPQRMSLQAALEVMGNIRKKKKKILPKMGNIRKMKRRKKKKKDEEKEEEKHDDRVIEVGDYSNMEAPSSLKTLCRYVETTLVPEDKTLQFTIDKEVFGRERDTFLLPEDITQLAGMEEI